MTGEAAQPDLERFCPYLHLLARMHLDPRLRGVDKALARLPAPRRLRTKAGVLAPRQIHGCAFPIALPVKATACINQSFRLHVGGVEKKPNE